jgi:hydrogenase maturation factor HypF (carbamoyltransferase family)
MASWLDADGKWVPCEVCGEGYNDVHDKRFHALAERIKALEKRLDEADSYSQEQSERR